ncbi:hypothetical protein B484DRAFT_465518 [Ochromonadaceae sp. CCMP2298]|nr:hypothetical protein B484DRAFT_465518 [Ochromonadaceae sp. CCMP2298]
MLRLGTLYAARGGHLEVLQWINTHHPPNVCSAAAKNGHLEMLHWLRAQNPSAGMEILICNGCEARTLLAHGIWDGKTCVAAAQNGNLNMLLWLRAQDPPYPWDEKTCACDGISLVTCLSVTRSLLHGTYLPLSRQPLTGIVSVHESFTKPLKW